MLPTESLGPKGEETLMRIMQSDLEEYARIKEIEYRRRQAIVELFKLGARVDAGKWDIDPQVATSGNPEEWLVIRREHGGQAEARENVTNGEESEARESPAAKAYYSFHVLCEAIKNDDLDWIGAGMSHREFEKRLRHVRTGWMQRVREWAKSSCPIHPAKAAAQWFHLAKLAN